MTRPRPITITWWHLEALAARLQELLPSQLELDLPDAPVDAKEPVEAVGDPHGPSGPTARLGTAPSPSETVEHHQCPKAGQRREDKTCGESRHGEHEMALTEIDLALWPLLYGPTGILGRLPRRPRL